VAGTPIVVLLFEPECVFRYLSCCTCVLKASFGEYHVGVCNLSERMQIMVCLSITIMVPGCLGHPRLSDSTLYDVP